MSRNVVTRVSVIAALLLSATFAQSQDAGGKPDAGSKPNAASKPDASATATPPPDPQAVADAIGKEVAEIRGLPFKRPVGVENQSVQSFSEYVDGKIDEAVPPAIMSNYGKIVQTLGLYSGPPIDNFSGMMNSVMSSQVGAYYDPEKQHFYVVMTRMPEVMQGALYSHELYHALQDQYFGLANYLAMKRDDPAFSSDRMLARQAVVEGEATYVMSLWTLKKMTKTIPSRAVLARVVGMQSNLSMEQLRTMLKQPQVAEFVGQDIRDAVDSTDQIPAFILDDLMGSYLKGLGFVFAVQEQGWPAVEKLYTDYPPQSTEQILHPEKWFKREAPVDFEWPDFAKVAELKQWELLDSDVLGEFHWRTIFKEQGLAAEAESASAGWGGDRYAVFKRKDSDAMLLLLRTSWDSADDATEFATAYARVMTHKYPDNGPATPTRLEQKGTDVYIVEGGDPRAIDALWKVVKKAKKKRT